MSKIKNVFNKYMLLEKIEELLKEVSSLTAKNAEDVEQLRLKYLSKKGEINALMADFRTVAADHPHSLSYPTWNASSADNCQE